MSVTRTNYPDLGLPAGPYVHSVIHGDTLYTSGFTAYGTDAQKGSAGAQTEATLDQLDHIARQHGKSLNDIIKVTIFLVEADDIPEVRTALTKRYGEALPASSLVMISSLFAPELRVEVEAIFAL